MLLFVIFFFFKQKTAYEMRISDWSSDVCSSDLLGMIELHDLAEALERLPEEQRQAVLLVGYEGLAYREAADVLDIPIGTVMSRLSRGREALRRMMNGAPMANLRKVQ